MNNNKESQATTSKEALLGATVSRPWWRRTSVWAGVAVLVAAGAGLAYWQSVKAARALPQYVSQEVKRGNLRLTVAANGTLVPTRQVNIGSELSGTVRNVRVDVNDRVKKDQVLVELDTAKLSAQVARSSASLASAQARQAQARATTKEARANLGRLEEVARLSGGKVPSAAELDTGRATLERAVADEQAAAASVQDARAALSTDQTNLSKASITSPIDGVVLTRAVDPGNAVAASLQAVTLFTLAEDLSRLKLEVSVDEADVGTVQPEQKATFTVSAYPSRTYPARVTRVAYGSTKTDNVVTYIATLEVANEDLSLRPGMTAAATITSTERKDVLLVPNAALRFTPTVPGAAPAAREGSSGGIMGQLMPRGPRPGGGGGGQRRGGAAGGKNDGGETPREVWVLEEGKAVAVKVVTGISDGRMTEVRSETLQPGMAVITDQRSGSTK
ncbi:MAG: efflux RND transporter periplasmic adaptor subunit [Comamonas sp.]|uniref:efflux RND transporter periplasmic adaptor subunit n=1 Tax=Comamonas sp. TaxID=34028 RepID=UPI002FCC0A6A